MRSRSVISRQPVLLAEGLLIVGEATAWVDVHGHDLWVIDRPGAAPARTSLPETPSVVLGRQGDGGWLVGDARGLLVVNPDGTTSRVAELADPDPEERANDGVRLPDGTVLLGTMHRTDAMRHPGRLHRFDPGAGLSIVVGPPICIPNTFLPLTDGQLLVTDSATATLLAVDPSTGDARVHPLTDAVRQHAGTPDGGCTNGDEILIAMWGGWQLLALDVRAGTVTAAHPVPTSRPSNVALHPHDPGRVVVTTAQEELTATDLDGDSLAGHVLVLELEA